MRKFANHILIALLLALIMLSACSPTRYLSESETMLSSVEIVSSSKQIKGADYRQHVRQEPNSRWFNLMKVPLGIYCLSSRDSSNFADRLFRRVGEAPVVYDSTKTKQTCALLTSTMQSHGFLHAVATAKTDVHNKRTRVKYILNPGMQSYIRTISYHFDNDSLLRLVLLSQSQSLIKAGMPLDFATLGEERNRLVSLMRNNGYFGINRDFLHFQADTASSDLGIHLRVILQTPTGSSPDVYKPHHITSVQIYEDVAEDEPVDTSHAGNRILLHRKGKKNKIRRRSYDSHIPLKAGQTFSEQTMRSTYSSLSQLPIIKFTSVSYVYEKQNSLDTIAVVPDSVALQARIYVQTANKYGITAELDGTNTSGDFGAAARISLTNRNILGGGEVLNLDLRAAYEAITGLEHYSAQKYTEYGATLSFRIPSLQLPFASRSVSYSSGAATELSASWSTQDRPEFHRRVLTANLAYMWAPLLNNGVHHRLDLVSLNYIYLPWISKAFNDTYLEGTDARSSILRSAYENLFIMRSAYSVVFHSSRQTINASVSSGNYQLKSSIETAGNLLYTISKLTKRSRDNNGQYNLFSIPFSQYVKFDIDYAKSFRTGESNSLALHFAAGVAIPYANSSIVPYEKRYFAGGANNVRGWSVRRLGPGSYSSNDGKVNYINQTGNLQLLLSLEFRTHLLWKFSGAAFVDAGNIWNTRRYDNIPGGEFDFKRFYKQIAVAYGLGLRFNLGYFTLRLDGGMKAVNPAIPNGKGHFPILHPSLKRDLTLHFAVGLPF